MGIACYMGVPIMGIAVVEAIIHSGRTQYRILYLGYTHFRYVHFKYCHFEYIYNR